MLISNKRYTAVECWRRTVLSLLLEFRTGLTLAAAMTTLSHILWPLAVLLIGLVEAHTLWSPSGSQTISEKGGTEQEVM